jgi:hypothetical protein
MIFNKEKRKLLIVFSFLPIFTLTCIALNQILDGYFLWICISQGSLMIYWQGSLIHTFQIGFSLRLPLWIPLLPLLVLILYNIIVSRSVKIKFSFRGMRVHHYFVGLLSLLIAASLTVMSMTIANEPNILFLGWKRTSTAQMLHSSSFLLNISGVTLILLDLKDLASTLATHIHKNLRKDDSKNKGDCNEEY